MENIIVSTINSKKFITQVELDEAFVPGAQLEEPLEAHTVEALRMWLDITYKSSLLQLPPISSTYLSFFHCCTHAVNMSLPITAR